MSEGRGDPGDREVCLLAGAQLAHPSQQEGDFNMFDLRSSAIVCLLYRRLSCSSRCVVSMLGAGVCGVGRLLKRPLRWSRGKMERW